MEKQGIMYHMVDTHSLRYRGVMVIKLSGNSDTLIMKFVWWSSLIFIKYIHEQTTHLSKGVYTAMRKHTPFNNIGAIER